MQVSHSLHSQLSGYHLGGDNMGPKITIDYREVVEMIKTVDRTDLPSSIGFVIRKSIYDVIDQFEKGELR